MNFLKCFTLSIAISFLLFCTVVNAAAIKGEFKQYKQFNGFAKPFISSGVFSLIDEKLIWQVKMPVESMLIIENGKVLAQNANGELIPQPGSEQFVGLLSDLLSVNMSALETRFDIAKMQGSCTQLTPKEAMLQQLFSDFILCETAKQVNSITLNEHSGNNTKIEFTYSK
ncbi:outer membrane lipoprotein carrier protein LolA [Pseudoalteromonas sp. NZS100]|uniref:outer membrane lipoprotein carrier protein LolA n=1 Tax=Pseudoalteromonas sp. NZS100 TaxID=2792046 RepID=UPI0018CFE9F8|nr:outer membrane lipoprotein carrier protein LolA [Pseudoalteromonas sp. NZS100]MBH0069142.1 outer membrane lipoprotein carrier protein LolA [Pseudoalteromonas sp. NZS100]